MFARKRGSAKRPANKKADPSDTIQAIQDLKASVQKLEKRRDYVQKKAQNTLALAKKDMTNQNKSAALLNLKRKKILDKEVATVDASILQIEQQILNLESGATNIDVYKAMKIGADAQKKLNAVVDPDKLQDLLGRIEEQNSDAAEIGELLAMAGDDTVNDPELLKELNEMEADILEDNAFKLPDAPEGDLEEDDINTLLDFEKLTVPTKVPAAKKAQKDNDLDALAKLEAEMIG